MAGNIQDQLNTLGIARVMVVLRNTTAAANASAFAKHFTASELAPPFQLAAAIPRAKTPPPLIHYPNLGVTLGTVDRVGLQNLRADKEHVAAVVAAPQLSIIRPTRVAAAKLKTTLTWGIKALGLHGRGHSGGSLRHRRRRLSCGAQGCDRELCRIR
jgi:hypothetical protein